MKLYTSCLLATGLSFVTSVAHATTFTPEKWVPFINGNLSYLAQQWYVENANETWNFSSPDNNTLIFRVEKGDDWKYDPSSKNRSEIDGAPSVIPVGTPITVSYQFEILPGAPITSSWFTIGQFHQTKEGVAGASFSPPFAINVGFGSPTNQEMHVTSAYENPPGTYVLTHQYIDPAPVLRNHWYNIKIDVMFKDYPNKGYLYIWRDGVLIVDYQGPIGFIGPIGEYWKEGIYRSASSETEVTEFKNLVLSTPKTPATPPSNPVSVRAYAIPATTVAGGAVNIVWNSLNATSCATNGFTSHTDISYDKLINVRSSQDYTVTCAGPGGVATSTVRVTVK